MKRCFLLSLCILSAACYPAVTPTPPPTPDDTRATVAAQATEQARLQAQLAGLATMVSSQSTQVAAQGTLIAYLEWNIQSGAYLLVFQRSPMENSYPPEDRPTLVNYSVEILER